jgi:predicted enzyme related to lactoylglutathione lyase
MTEGLKTIIYPVVDLAKATALFTQLLGVEPAMQAPYYVGFEAGGQHVGLDPNGHKSGMTGPVPFWHVDDIRKTIQSLLDAGAVVRQDAKDVGGGRLVASLADPDGNAIGLIQDWGASGSGS